MEEPDAIKIFQASIDRGINFSDNSWDYNEGESERRVGKALKGRRDNVFVMTKYDGRTKGSALKQLDESLERLQVDHVDLWQFHENIRLEDPDRFFAEGGAVEAVREAKKQGKSASQVLRGTKIRLFISEYWTPLTNMVSSGLDGTERGKLAAALDARGAAIGSCALFLFALTMWLSFASWTLGSSLFLSVGVWFASSILIWRVRQMISTRL